MNRLCSVDGLSTATDFCCCLGTETYLCEQHLVEHMRKGGLVHSILPMKAHGEHTSEGYLDNLNRRAQVKAEGIKELESHIASIDACMMEVQTRTEEAVWTLTVFARKMIAELITVKEQMQREITEALAEIEEKHFMANPSVNSKLTAALREFVPGKDRFVLFRYQINANILQLKDFVTYEVVPLTPAPQIKQEPAIPIIPLIHGTKLITYYPQLEKTTKALLSGTFNEGAVFCLLDDAIILCVDYTSSHSLHLHSTNIVKLGDLNYMRWYSGLIKCGPTAYVFGGYNSERKCEKFSIATSKWFALSDMQNPRRNFSPCSLGDQIYLYELQSEHRVMETFSITTETFKAFPVTIPSSLSTGHSVSFIFQDELVIVDSSANVGKLLIKGETKFRVSMAAEGSYKSPFSSNVTPMIWNDSVYWVSYNECRLVKFDLATNITSSTLCLTNCDIAYLDEPEQPCAYMRR